ncbi:hypothetical protein PROFUN_07743 [Planoprotostelium fungivorum]|uniref:Uncharacterized protein n=1 Tax=Planoprotostelium fungivorum TaxID=1890364 RepID=A0A2P6N1I5_9EUKA|nr:hypothetical protein PROFUN_07743 [Planoprotostelium fungivorum]
MSRKFPFPDYDVTTLLMDKSLTDVVISNTLSTLRCIMNIEGEALIPPSIRLLLVMCACTENSETNPFLRYIMEMSLADTLAHVLSIESVIYACHIDIMMIFHILLSYRPADRDNPYVILLNDQPEVLRKLYELIHVTLAEDMGDIKSEKIVPDRTTTGVVNYVYSYFHTPTVFVPSDVPATTVFSITLFSTLYDTLHVNYRHVNAVRDSGQDGRSTTDTHGLRTLLNLLFVLFSRGVHKESALLCHPIVDALSDVTRRNENLDSWSLRVDTMKNGEAVIVEGTVASVITTVLRSYISSDHDYQDSRLLRKCLVCLYQLSQPEDAETPNLPTIQLELKGKAIDMMYSFAEEEEEDQVLVQWFKDLRVKGRDEPNYTL